MMTEVGVRSASGGSTSTPVSGEAFLGTGVGVGLGVWVTVFVLGFGCNKNQVSAAAPTNSKTDVRPIINHFRCRRIQPPGFGSFFLGAGSSSKIILGSLRLGMFSSYQTSYASSNRNQTKR